MKHMNNVLMKVAEEHHITPEIAEREMNAYLKLLLQEDPIIRRMWEEIAPEPDTMPTWQDVVLLVVMAEQTAHEREASCCME